MDEISFNPVNIKPKRRSSLFRVLSPSSSQFEKESESEQYEKDLKREVAQWADFLKENCAKSNQNSPLNLHKDILNAEQKIYCDLTPNFNEFFEKSHQFQSYSEFYLKMQENYLEGRKNLDNTLMKKLEMAAFHINNKWSIV